MWDGKATFGKLTDDNGVPFLSLLLMKYVGAHVSAAVGVENAQLNAHKLGATAFAMFTKNQRQWQAKPLTQTNIELFKERCETYGFKPEQILHYDSYLINLEHPETEASKSPEAHFWMRCSAACSWVWIGLIFTLAVI